MQPDYKPIIKDKDNNQKDIKQSKSDSINIYNSNTFNRRNGRKTLPPDMNE